MDKKSVEGQADRIKGRVKETVGVATGDRELEREGKLDQAKGKIKDVAGKVREGIKEKLDELHQQEAALALLQPALVAGENPGGQSESEDGPGGIAAGAFLRFGGNHRLGRHLGADVQRRVPAVRMDGDGEMRLLGGARHVLEGGSHGAP